MFSRKALRALKTEITAVLNWSRPYGKESYSQYGEDLILQKIFGNKSNGFYVDIGAHHPFRYSNTYLLYERGWKGINIDPTPGVKKLFDRTRKKDINLSIAIGIKEGKSTLYMFNDSALNTLNKKRANQVIKSCQSALLKKVSIRTIKLSSVLKKYVPKATNIDFLNIDVEGNELSVLKSNDWKKHIPSVILVENIIDKKKRKITSIEKYLKGKGYKMHKRAKLTQIYVYKSF